MSNIPLLTGPIDPSMETFNVLIEQINAAVEAASTGGTVTSVTAGTGLSGGTITGSGTIAVADNTANTLAGFDNSGVFSDVTIGSNLTLSDGVLSAGAGATTFAALTDILEDKPHNIMINNGTLPAGIVPASAQETTGFGNDALHSLTTGVANVAYGDGALFAVTTGGGNTTAGSGSLVNIVTGNQNTAIGNNAGPATDLSNTISIGSGAVAPADHTVQIGRTDSDKPTDVYFGDATALLHADVSACTGLPVGATQIVLTGISSATTFTLPANSFITSALIRLVSGTIGASMSNVTLSNASNVFPNSALNLTGNLSPSTVSGTGSYADANGVLQTVSASPLTTTFDLNDAITPNSQWGTAVVDVVITYLSL